MRTRIKYLRLRHTIPEEARKEVKPCGVCGARLYLEGKSGVLDHSAVPVHGPNENTNTSSSSSTSSSSNVALPPAKRAKTAAETVKALKDLKDLKDQSLLDSPDFKNLKDRLLRGE